MHEVSDLIRPVRPGDADELFGMVRAFAAHVRMEERVTGSAAQLREHLFGERSFIECVVAEEDGHLAGFALFYLTYSTFRTQPMMWLEDLFVRPDRRGAGWGRALLERVARRARERGCWRLDWSVLQWNEPAIEFYERVGARRRAADSFQYGFDESDLAAFGQPSRLT
jgi:GNAT superfamily N-acetyltransferase